MRIAALGFVLLFGAVVAAVPGLRWRTHLIELYATGRIADLSWRELFELISPRNPQSLEPLVAARNPYAVISDPVSSTADLESGRQLFRDDCGVCHGVDGTGSSKAPSLVGRALTHGASDWALFRTIRYGVTGTAMPAHPELSTLALWQIVAFLRVLEEKSHASVTAQDAALDHIEVDVPYAELRAIRNPGREWLTYSGSYSGTRHSELRQIDGSNVNQLALRWEYQFQGDPDMVQCSPLVRNGVMFATLPPGRVIALDARTGRRLWRFDPSPAPADAEPVSEAVNRGVALLDDRLFVGTWDARLLALSSSNGKLLWERRVEPSAHRWISSAPLAYRDLIVIGTGFKEGRGALRAYDAATGKQRWIFETVPPPGTAHHDSWPGDSWRSGGAPTWQTGTYDPASDLLFWGVGNPKPDYDASGRRGDNLYSNSVVALKGSTGKLVWFFQFTPGDDHDWDSNQIPILADVTTSTGTRHVLLFANRNGFYYVLDRASGRFLAAAPYARQNWTAGIDASGRPIPLPVSSADSRGRLVYPSNIGATNWWSPSFDPELNLTFVPFLEHGMVFFPAVNSIPMDTNQPFFTGVRALEATSGRLVWERHNDPRFDVPLSGGLLSTASGLLFGGDSDRFFALDARTGKLLWSVRTGGNVLAAPITYELDGEQFVAIAAGRDLLTFALPAARPEAGVLTNNGQH